MAAIKTKNFALRPYKRSDLDSLVKNLNDKGVSRYLCNVHYPYTKNLGKKWIENCIRNFKKRTSMAFVIEINGELAGSIALDRIEGHKAELGYWLGKKYWNQGIMTKAVKLITDFGYKKLGLKRIQAHVFIENKKSAHILSKNNFQKEGLIRKHTIKDRKFIDQYLYAKIK